MERQTKQDQPYSKKMDDVIQEFMKAHIFENGQLIRYLIEFFGYYLNIPADYSEFNNLGEHYDFHRKMDFETLKGKMSKSDYTDRAVANNKSELKTLAGETVRSFEEILIANFLFLNSINYEYERDYPINTRTESHRQYVPDFYLPDYDIYLEHFGINEEGQTPWLSDIEGEKYVADMEWKRSKHIKHGTTLLETYSFYNKQGVLIEKLQEQLLAKGVKFQEADYLTIFNFVYQEGKDKYFKEFVKLLSNFLGLFKSSGYQEEHFKMFMKQNKSNADNGFLKRRTELFLLLVQPIYCYYQGYLKEIQQIDFTDMINEARDLIQKKNLQFPYRYIIIDEYQDISKNRFGLINAIRKQTDAKVMCVGDDWQSIYRFAGSDLQLFTQFGDYFGAFELMRIEQTYRNSQQLVDVAGKFVMKNQAQLKKALKSNQQNSRPIHLVGYQNDKNSALRLAIERIVKEFGDSAEILLLVRNKYDINFLEEDPEFQVDKTTGQIQYSRYQDVNLFFLTVHKSKGLESDNVILINGENSTTGFPNQMVDDPVLAYVLTEKDQHPFAEERRLFYVALTRTKNCCYILAPEQKMSVFIKELIDDRYATYQLVTKEHSLAQNPKCPKCKTGHLTRRVGKTAFLGCTNYPKCEYQNPSVKILTERRPCPECGDFLVLKNGRFGPYYGCSNKKHGCEKTENVEKTSNIRKSAF